MTPKIIKELTEDEEHTSLATTSHTGYNSVPSESAHGSSKAIAGPNRA